MVLQHKKSVFLNQKHLLFFLSLFAFVLSSEAQDLRPPAYPLVTSDPYFSIWSFTDTLNGSSTVHWTGKENSLQGIIRVDGKSYYYLGVPKADLETVLPLTGTQEEWTYITEEPEEGWTAIDFDDSRWKRVRGAFSDDGRAPNPWDTEDLWVRRSFELDNTDFEELMLNMHQDDNIQVYINGVLAFEREGWNDAPELFEISGAAKKTLQKGKNILAVHIRNTAGGSYLDVGLVDRREPSIEIDKAQQQSVAVSATQTAYRFLAGGVQLDLTFTAPLLLDDLELVSRPVNYVSFEVKSTDQKSHDVQLYFSSAGDLAVHSPDQKVNWNRSQTENLNLMRVGTESQDILGKKGDDVRIDWGYHYLAIPKGSGISSLISSSISSTQDFAENGSFTLNDDTDKPRAVNESPVTLAAVYELGAVSTSPESRHLMLAYDDIYSIEYFHQKLKAWWRRDGATMLGMLDRAEEEYEDILRRATDFDEELRKETIAAGGEKYAQLAELVYRHSIAAHKLVEGPDGKPLFLSKENFSNGSIGTVDLTYPSSPLYLRYNPELLKGMMRPILYYSESGKYDHPFAAHDVGTYPIANGMTYGEPMPVEESGNMLILAAAVAKAEGDASFAEDHWEILSTWAEYLKEKGLDPENQLSTDDFSGHLAHNANLSIKAILGLASYGYLADRLGKGDIGGTYTETAKDYARQWIEKAEDGDHFSLTFDKKGTWSQKYNLIWDKVLQLDVFPKEVAEKELKYYLTKQNKYGLPLDSRETYTKADWVLWTATLAEDRTVFDKLADRLFKYADETPSRVPMSDWYDTKSAKQMNFQARSVVGALFMKALYERWSEE